MLPGNDGRRIAICEISWRDVVPIPSRRCNRSEPAALSRYEVGFLIPRTGYRALIAPQNKPPMMREHTPICKLSRCPAPT